MRKRLALLLLAGVAALPVRAMQFHPVGDTLVLSGPVDGSDLVQLRNHLAERSFRRVLLHQSPGGDLFNGYRLAERIRDEGLETAVSGKCESACGLIFLGGVRRHFSDGRPIGETMVGLHGAFHFQSGQPLPELSPRMAYVIRSFTGGRYPADLLQRTVYPAHPHDLVYTFHPRRFKAEALPTGVMECLKQADANYKCRMFDGLDAIGIGVVTEPEILELAPEVKAVLEGL